MARGWAQAIPRLVFQAGRWRHREIGLYDFPQRRIGLRLVHVFAPLIRLPFVRPRFIPRTKEARVMPLRRVLDAV
jgi:hypothetical protein